MTAQEKAKELVAKMEKDFQYFASREIAIKHALIAVDEIIKQWEYVDSILIDCWSPNKIGLNYWNQVKHELEKL